MSAEITSVHPEDDPLCNSSRCNKINKWLSKTLKVVLPRLSYQPKDRGDEADSKTNSHTPSNSSAPTGGDCDSSIEKPQRSQVLEEEVSRSEEGHALVHMLRDGTPNSNQVPIGGPCTQIGRAHV